jgi:phosphate transport system substrate-binding protein
MPKSFAYLAVALSLLLSSACAPAATKPRVDPLAGVYAVGSGGGAIYHAQALTQRFAQLHPGVVMQVENVGSDAAIDLTDTGGIDVGFTSRDLKEDEKSKVNALRIGGVGTSVIVNADNPVTGLTSDQIRGLFSGEITDWAQVGGPPGKVRVLVREKTASTRMAFESYFFPDKPKYSENAAEFHDIDQMMESVKSFKGAIGMVTLEESTLKDPGVRHLAIDGVPASIATLKDGTYPVRRNVYLIYSADPGRVKPAIHDFVDFTNSSEGKRALESVNAQSSSGAQK